MSTKYLGDGINLDHDGHHVILTSITGRVYLKPQVVDQLQSAIVSLKTELRKKKRKVSPEDYFKRLS